MRHLPTTRYHRLSGAAGIARLFLTRLIVTLVFLRKNKFWLINATWGQKLVNGNRASYTRHKRITSLPVYLIGHKMTGGRIWNRVSNLKRYRTSSPRRMLTSRGPFTSWTSSRGRLIYTGFSMNSSTGLTWSRMFQHICKFRFHWENFTSSWPLFMKMEMATYRCILVWERSYQTKINFNRRKVDLKEWRSIWTLVL